MQIHKISGTTAVLLRKLIDYKTILDDVNGNSVTVSTYTLVSVLKSIFLQTSIWQAKCLESICLVHFYHCLGVQAGPDSGVGRL